jgi:hypothetical protein
MHDGYARLDAPVRHVRSVRHAPDGSWVITDHFQGEGRHTFELNFHFHPAVTVRERDGGWLAERNGLTIKVELADGRFQPHRGEQNPLLGWFSSAYNRKEPTSVLQSVRRGISSEVRFETTISVLPESEEMT